MVPAPQKNDTNYYKDWNYVYPGTRTRDIQNRYPVPKKMNYPNDVLQFKDVTHTGSNTWRHNNSWYQQDMSKMIKK